MSLAVHQHDNDDPAARKVPAAANLAPLSQSAPDDVESSMNNDTVEKPHSIFTLNEKWFLVGLASFSALFR